MNEIVNYIEPELIVLIPVLYFVGIGLKKHRRIKDSYIPLLLGISGVLMSCLYMFGMKGFSLISLFMAICQGILCAGMSVYSNQIYKQLKNRRLV